MILVACLSALISALSPFWGLIFIFTIGAKYQQENLFPQFYGIFLLTAAALFFTRTIEVITFVDILIGVALSSYLFFKMLPRKYDYVLTIVSVFTLNVIYGVVRYFLFSKQILQGITLASEELTKLYAEVPPENQALILFFSELIESTKYVITNFFPGIWVLTIMLAVYIGSLLFSARTNRKWLHKKVRMPYELVYLVIGCLAAFLFKSTRII
ncbi:hypothetical protein ACFLYK_03235, partial [Candidatus Cloacimonadota bacterium]